MSRETIQKMHDQKISGGYVVILRVALGLAFLTTWMENLRKGVFTATGFKDTIEYFLEPTRHIETPFDIIIKEVAIANTTTSTFFGLGWMIFELLIALSLTFGILTRLGSLIGAGSTVILGLGSLGAEWIWTQPILFVGFLTCALISAGRWYGADYWLQEKIPEKYVKFLI